MVTTITRSTHPVNLSSCNDKQLRYIAKNDLSSCNDSTSQIQWMANLVYMPSYIYEHYEKVSTMASSNNNKFTDTQIDKRSPLPYHYQLREIIRSAIAANYWQVGDQLPSENQLCEDFDVSRTTVREALDALVGEGLLTREKGVGTFVADPKFMEQWSGTSIGFSDSIVQQGYKIETRVLQLEVVPVSHEIRKELYLQSDENVILLRRLRFILDQPILVVNSYLPEKLLPGLVDIDFSDRSLYQTFRDDYNLQLARVKRSIEAVAADDNIASLLQVPQGFPIMFIRNITYQEDGTPIEFYLAWRRGDKSRFEFEYNVPEE